MHHNTPLPPPCVRVHACSENTFSQPTTAGKRGEEAPPAGSSPTLPTHTHTVTELSRSQSRRGPLWWSMAVLVVMISEHFEIRVLGLTVSHTIQLTVEPIVDDFSICIFFSFSFLMHLHL